MKTLRTLTAMWMPVLLLAVGLTACGDDTPTKVDPPAGDHYSVITTYAGTGTAGRGEDGLDPLATELYLPQDLTFGPDGRAYFLDWNNHRVCVIAAGVVQTLIGTGELGDAPNGPAITTKLNHPTHIAFDPNGQLILSAWHNSKIMRMSLSTGMIEAICGDGRRSFAGDGGPANMAVLDLPVCTAFDGLGRMYITDQANQCIRMIDENGIIRTVVGKPKEPGFTGDGGPAVEAKISLPGSQSAPPVGRMEFDEAGVLYFADTVNNRIRTVDQNGVIRTVAGSGMRGYAGDGGLATEASLAWPADVAISPDGELFIADTRNSVIRKVDANGVITTFAGEGGVAEFAGDGGKPSEALLNRPYGITFDSDGNFYIADTHNHRIRVVRR